MSDAAVEDCPICWRSFSVSLVPVTIVCGHSFCSDCSDNLKKCPMCRRRLSAGYQRVTNYSLLSLVGRLEQNSRKETRDQQVQTEKLVRNPCRTQTIGSEGSGKARPLIIKLNKMDTGLFKCLELKFK